MTKAENTPKIGETAKNGDRADEPISIIEKGRTSDVRVSLSEFHGRSYLDIRTHVVVDATGDRVRAERSHLDNALAARHGPPAGGAA